MAAIILEGPDGSGKTSLAYALLGIVDPRRSQYIKSPLGRAPQWDQQFNYWHQAMIGRYPNKLVVLDRTPEISENVYGPIIRGQTRISSPINSLLSLNSPYTRIIMCVGSTGLEGEHLDAHGNDIVQHHIEVVGAYNMVNDIMRKSIPVDRLWLWDKSEPDWERIQFNVVDLYRNFIMVSQPDFWTAYEIGKEMVDADAR